MEETGVGSQRLAGMGTSVPWRRCCALLLGADGHPRRKL
jgi:hypothetical protein